MARRKRSRLAPGLANETFVSRRPEAIVLAGVPVPRLAYLEEQGAPMASFLVWSEVPAFLGGTDPRPSQELVMFQRTAEERNGLAVFEPVE